MGSIKHKKHLSIISNIILVIIHVIVAVSCEKASNGPYRQVTVYGREVASGGDTHEIAIEIDSGKINFYVHDTGGIIFETAIRSLEAVENESPEDVLLETLCIMEENNGRVMFKCPGNKGKKSQCNTIVDIDVYMPARIKSVDIRVGKGDIIFHDDVGCDITVNAGIAGVLVKSINGRINVDGQAGNVRISSGKLKDGSQVRVGTGNLYIAAEQYRQGMYSFETGKGNIFVLAPREDGIVFENLGIAYENAFKSSGASVRVRLKSDIGEISIIKTIP